MRFPLILTEAVEKAKVDREAKLALLESQIEKFQKELASTKLQAEDKIRKQKEYLAQTELARSDLDLKLRNAQENLVGTKKSLQGMQFEYQKSIALLSKSKETLEKTLANSLAKKNERKKLAEKISTRLANIGISARVDAETGEVTVQFLEEYFEYGKAELKPKMREQLAKLFPAYAAALFEDPLNASKILNVDIIGFASPTFRGRYVNPDSLKPDDKAAIDFNMDLSYKRAKSIFAHVFDVREMKFAYQRDLLALVKVTGRSYLAERREKPKEKGRELASEKSKDYCQEFDCQKSQKVIIKFNLKED